MEVLAKRGWGRVVNGEAGGLSWLHGEGEGEGMVGGGWGCIRGRWVGWLCTIAHHTTLQCSIIQCSIARSAGYVYLLSFLRLAP